jgi:predicted MFS family arabinose efflux permease
MAKIDEIKEEIGWLKIVFGILTAIDVSLLGWLAQNYQTKSIYLVFTSVVLIILVTVGIILVNKSAYTKIRKLKDL